MPRLKSRNEFPPTGFKFLQPETGFDTWTNLKHQSFKAVVDAVVAHRLGNPHIGDKVGWRTDYEGVADEVDDYVARLNVIQGYPQFVVDGGGEPPPFYRPLSHLAGQLAGAVGRGLKAVAGVGTLIEWLGDGGTPVAVELATRRAWVCAERADGKGCPKNGNGNWTSKFTAKAAHELKLQLAIKHDLDLKTPHDARLNVCEACLCQMQLKVWTPFEHIAKHTSAETLANLDKNCWILAEKKA